MPTLYLVRHGQSEGLAPGTIIGQMDMPLTELGVEQARAVGEHLKSKPLTAVYSSDLSRTQKTAEAIAVHHGLPVLSTPLVRECSLGRVEGLTEEQFQKRYPDEFRLWQDSPVANRPPGAEKFERVIGRCGEFLNSVRDTHGVHEEIAVAGHIGSIGGLICAAFGLPVTFYLSVHVSNASITIIELGERSVLRVLNDTCHLGSLLIP
jgi:broad specificity phosphatase PhoE